MEVLPTAIMFPFLNNSSIGFSFLDVGKFIPEERRLSRRIFSRHSQETKPGKYMSATILVSVSYLKYTGKAVSCCESSAPIESSLLAATTARSTFIPSCFFLFLYTLRKAVNQCHFYSLPLKEHWTLSGISIFQAAFFHQSTLNLFH